MYVWIQLMLWCWPILLILLRLAKFALHGNVGFGIWEFCNRLVRFYELWQAKCWLGKGSIRLIRQLETVLIYMRLVVSDAWYILYMELHLSIRYFLKVSYRSLLTTCRWVILVNRYRWLQVILVIVNSKALVLTKLKLLMHTNFFI